MLRDERASLLVHKLVTFDVIFEIPQLKITSVAN